MLRLFQRSKTRRVLILGLDCAAPHLVFEQFRADLPNLSRLMDGGTWGILESSVPCITVPAWASMLSSRDPGVLGIYGFRNRASYDYDSQFIASGTDVKVKRVWDYLSAAGRPSIVAAVPQTYPVRPLEGHLIAGFPASSTDTAFTYPAVYKQEVLKQAPDYPFDINGFRTEDKAALLQRIIDFTETQYRVFEAAITSKPWDFAVHVNMGVDRIHHGFWRYHDPAHRLYEPGNPFEQAIRDYYRQVDAWVGRLVERAGDDTAVLVVSDHGVARMDGGICLNEWLWREGWLVLKSPPPDGQITPFESLAIDWAQTRAWGSGGYYGRVYLNVAGREPQGVIPAADYERTRDTLAAALQAIPGPDGVPLETQVFKPQEIYTQVNGVAPDLLTYFGGLHWRSVGSLGHGGLYTLENDTGPDDANHHPDGLYIVYDPNRRGTGAAGRRQLMDIAPTVLHRLGIAVPGEIQGRPLA